MRDNISSELERSISEKLPIIQQGIVDYAIGGERRPYPWRNPERTPYEVVLAEILLKRTTATIASRMYMGILKRFPTLESIERANLEDISQVLAPLGLKQQRASSLKNMASYLLSRRGGKVPDDLTGLLAVPGLGDYGARAVLSFARNLPAAIVDSNVERVIRRVFEDCMPTKPALSLYQDVANRLLPYDQHREYNFGILDLGALVCRPIRPLHEQCPLRDVCDYYRHMREEGASHALQASSVSPLRKARQAKGLTLVQLAKLSRVTKRTILNIEHGRTNPTAVTLGKLAAALDLTSHELQPSGAASSAD